MKENDYLLNALSNPDFSNVDFANVGLNANNTSIESKDTYKKLNYIQSNPIFQTDGKFDETKFDEFYDAALVGYNRFSSDLTARDVAKQISYYKGDIFAPVLQRNLQPEFKIEKVATNPDRQKKSAWGVNMYSNPTMSRREIALSLLVYDDVNKEWKEAPNDGGFFGNFGNTLVLATWDSDGTHTDPISGLLVNHKKGTPKLNENGTYYYEPLGNRDIYGKEVLSNFDVITTDGSTWNKYDFLDSDDLEKSLTGTLIRNIIKVAPAFIPYVAPWYLAGRIGLESVDLFSKLGKMTFGSDSPTLSALEGFSKSMELSSSDHAQQHPWSLESILNLSADVFTQLAEQRWLFEYAPSLLKGNKLGFSKKAQVEFTDARKANRLSEIEANLKALNRPDVTILQVLSENGAGLADAVATANRELEAALKSNYKLGEYLSKAYMTGITVADSYGEAIHNGASDMEAALFTLGYAIGEYGILNTQLGEWIMPELRIEKQRLNAAIRALAKQPSLLATQAEKATWIGKVIQAGKDWWSGETAGTGKRMGVHMLSNALGEGVEEVSEEALQDFSKALFNASRYLAGDSTRLTPTWQGEDGKFNLMNTLNDYALNFVGGFIGGGIGNLKTVYNQATKMPDFSGDDGRKNAFKELVYYIREGKGNEIKSLASKLRLGDANKSVEIVPLSQGGFQFAAGTKENNLDTFVKKTFNQFVDKILEIVNLERDVKTESEIQVDLILKDLRFQHLLDSKVLPDYLQDYHNEVSNLTALSLELDRILKDKPDSGDFSPEQQKKIADLEEKIKESRKILEEYVDGTQGKEFIKDGIFEMEEGLSRGYLPKNIEQYIRVKDYLKGHDRNLSEIPEDELKQYKTEWENFKLTSYKEQLRSKRKLFDFVNTRFSNKLKEHVDSYLTENYNNYILTVEESTIGEGSITSHIDNIEDTNKAKDWIELYLNENPIAPASNISKLTIYTGALINSVSNNEELKKIYEALRLLESYTFNEEHGLVDTNGNPLSEETFLTIANFAYPALVGKSVEDPGMADLLRTIKVNEMALMQKLLSKVFDETNADDVIKGAHFMKVSTRAYLKHLVDEFATDKEKYYKAIDSVKYTPIDELLDSLKMISRSTNDSITDLIKKYTTILSSNSREGSFSEFGIEENDLQAILNALELTEILFSHLAAARTDDINYDTPFGYNVTINDLIEDSDLVTYDVNTFNVLSLDLAKTLNELKLFKKIIEVNTDTFLNKLPTIDVNKTFKMANALRSILTVDIPDDWEGKTELLKGLQEVTEGDLKNILFTPEGIKKTAITIGEKERVLLLQQKMKLSDLIYNFFLKNKNKTSEQFEDVFLSKGIDPIAKYKIGLLFNLQSDSDDFTSEDKEPSIRTIFAFIKANSVLRYSDFLNEYKEALKSNLPYVYANGIENAVFHQRAHVIEKTLQSKFDEVYNKIISRYILNNQNKQPLYYNIDNLGKNNHAHLQFPNTYLVEGGPGAGKSTANTATLLTLAKNNSELTLKIFLVHTTLERAEAWRDRLLREIPELKAENFLCFSHESYANHINSERSTININKRQQLQKDLRISIAEDNTAHFEFEENSMTTDNGTPSLVLIDEVTKVSTLDLFLHEKYIDSLNVRAIAYGDFSQGTFLNEYTVEGTSNIDALYSHRNNFSGTYKLRLSFRSDNKYLTESVDNIESVNKEILQIVKDSDSTPYSDIIDDSKQIKYNLSYHEGEKGLFGVKVMKGINTSEEVDEVSDFARTVDLMLRTLKTDSDYITFAHNNPNSKLKAYMEKLLEIHGNKIRIVEGSIQGDEGLYYIIEDLPIVFTNPEWTEDVFENDEERAEADDTIILYTKDLYTNISRSQQGTLFISTQNAMDVLFEESKSKPEPGTFRLSLEAIDKANTNQIKAIETVLEGSETNSVELKNKPRTTKRTTSSEYSPETLKNNSVEEILNKTDNFINEEYPSHTDGTNLLRTINELIEKDPDNLDLLDKKDLLEQKINELPPEDTDDAEPMESDTKNNAPYLNDDPNAINAHLYSFNANEVGLEWDSNKWVVKDEKVNIFYKNHKDTIQSLDELSDEEKLKYFKELVKEGIDFTSMKGLILTKCINVEYNEETKRIELDKDETEYAFKLYHSLINVLTFGQNSDNLDINAILKPTPLSGFEVRLCAKTESISDVATPRFSRTGKNNIVQDLYGVKNPNKKLKTPMNKKIVALIGLKVNEAFIPVVEIPMLTLPSPLSMLESFGLYEAFIKFMTRTDSTFLKDGIISDKHILPFISSPEFEEVNISNEIKENFKKVVYVYVSNSPYIKYLRRNNNFVRSLKDLEEDTLKIIGINVDNTDKGSRYFFTKDYTVENEHQELSKLFNYDKPKGKDASKRIYVSLHCYAFTKDFTDADGNVIIKRGKQFTFVTTDPEVITKTKEAIMAAYIDLVLSKKPPIIVALGILSPSTSIENYYDYLWKNVNTNKKKVNNTNKKDGYEDNTVITSNVGNKNTVYRVLTALLSSDDFINKIKEESNQRGFLELRLSALKNLLNIIKACEEHNKTSNVFNPKITVASLLSGTLMEFGQSIRDALNSEQGKLLAELINTLTGNPKGSEIHLSVLTRFKTDENNPTKNKSFIPPKHITESGYHDHTSVGHLLQSDLIKLLFRKYGIGDIAEPSIEVKNAFKTTLKDVPIYYHIPANQEGELTYKNETYTVLATDKGMMSEGNSQINIQTTGKVQTIGLFGNAKSIIEDFLYDATNLSDEEKQAFNEYIGKPITKKSAKIVTFPGDLRAAYVEKKGYVYFKNNTYYLLKLANEDLRAYYFTTIDQTKIPKYCKDALNDATIISSEAKNDVIVLPDTDNLNDYLNVDFQLLDSLNGYIKDVFYQKIYDKFLKKYNFEDLQKIGNINSDILHNSIMRIFNAEHPLKKLIYYQGSLYLFDLLSNLYTTDGNVYNSYDNLDSQVIEFARSLEDETLNKSLDALKIEDVDEEFLEMETILNEIYNLQNDIINRLLKFLNGRNNLKDILDKLPSRAQLETHKKVVMALLKVDEEVKTKLEKLLNYFISKSC